MATRFMREIEATAVVPPTTTFFSEVYSASTETGSATISYSPAPSPAKVSQDKIAKEAVYNYLRFLKSRGRSVVGADEVARALSLPISQVERLAASLKTRGVRLEN